MDDRLPDADPHRSRRQGRHSADHHPPGAGGREHGRRLQPRHERPPDRCVHHAARPRRGERLQRRRSRLRGQRAAAGASRRRRAEPLRRPPRLRRGEQLRRHHQVVRLPRRPRPGSRPLPHRVHPAQARQAGAGADRDPLRPGHHRVRQRRRVPARAGAPLRRRRPTTYATW